MKHSRQINDYLFFAEAWLLMAIARFMLAFLPFKKIIPVLGKLDDKTVNDTANNGTMLLSVKLAIERACRYSPWRTKCFEQALTAKMMLKRRNVTSTVFFGVYKADSNKLNAHAWLKCNGQAITGGNNLEHYTILSSFKS